MFNVGPINQLSAFQMYKKIVRTTRNYVLILERKTFCQTDVIPLFTTQQNLIWSRRKCLG